MQVGVDKVLGQDVASIRMSHFSAECSITIHRPAVTTIAFTDLLLIRYVFSACRATAFIIFFLHNFNFTRLHLVVEQKESVGVAVKLV